MKFKITEQEKKIILGLYEQKSQTTVEAAKLDDLSVALLPSEFIKSINDELLKNQELVDKINNSFNTNIGNNPLQFLTSNGIIPYLFVVPNYQSPMGEGFPTTGLSINIDGTPFTINVNLGTNPKNILNSLKFTQMRIALPIGNR